MNYEIIRLIDAPYMKDSMALWFHQKWGIPQEAYIQSMDECLAGGNVPQWYVAVENGKILSGLGVIKNDFHNRYDLTPNVCAVYTEDAYRGGGLAGALYGLDSIPEEWLSKLIKREYIEDLCDKAYQSWKIVI